MLPPTAEPAAFVGFACGDRQLGIRDLVTVQRLCAQLRVDSTYPDALACHNASTTRVW